MIFRGFMALALVSSVSCVNAGAASAEKTVKVHAVFNVYYQQIRPTNWAGVVTHDFTLLMSGKNQIHEDYYVTSGKSTKHDERSGSLGAENLWHVVGPHTLQRIFKWPQNVDVATIYVNGSSCSVAWKEALLLGAKEYAFPDLYGQEIKYYEEPKLMDSQCTVTKVE